MTAIPTLKADVRAKVGRKENECLRAEHRVPAQTYGHGKPNETFSLDEHELEMLLRKKPALINLEWTGGSQHVLIRELQHNPFARVMHVDFQRVNLDEPVDTRVPLEFEGNLQGAEQGAHLEIQHSSIHVRVKAGAIPAYIVANVNEIPVGKRLVAKDVKLPEGAVLLGRPNLTICQNTTHRRAEPKADAATAPVAGEGEAAGTDAKAGDAKGGDKKAPAAGGDKKTSAAGGDKKAPAGKK